MPRSFSLDVRLEESRVVLQCCLLTLQGPDANIWTVNMPLQLAVSVVSFSKQNVSSRSCL